MIPSWTPCRLCLLSSRGLGLSLSAEYIYPLSSAMLCCTLWNKVQFNYMVAETLTRAHSCFNHPTGGYEDEEKLRSSHPTVDHHRAMSHEEAVRRWWSVARKDLPEQKPYSSNRMVRSVTRPLFWNFIAVKNTACIVLPVSFYPICTTTIGVFWFPYSVNILFKWSTAQNGGKTTSVSGTPLQDLMSFYYTDLFSHFKNSTVCEHFGDLWVRRCVHCSHHAEGLLQGPSRAHYRWTDSNKNKHHQSSWLSHFSLSS